MNSAADAIVLPDHLINDLRQRAADCCLDHRKSVLARADRTIAIFMLVQWLVQVIDLMRIAPWQWIEICEESFLRVDNAVFAGGAIMLLTFYVVWKHPGRVLNRYLVVAAQALTSSLVLRLTGAQIETHDLLLGSLALMWIYRDWQVLLAAGVPCAADLAIRTFVWPGSVTPTSLAAGRLMVHPGWLFFHTLVLVVAAIQMRRDMWHAAFQITKQSIATELSEREVQRKAGEMVLIDRRLRLSEARVRSIIETASDAFVVVASNGKVVEWSDRAESLFGWNAGEVIGRDICQVLGVVELARQFCDSAAQAMIQKRFGQRLETTARHRNGDAMLLEASISAMFFNHENVLNVFFHDISVRKAVQTQLLHSQKMQAIGQLAAGIAHEINTPTQYAGDNMRFLMDSFREIVDVLALLRTDQANAAQTITEWLAWRKSASSEEINYLCDEIPTAIEQAIDGIRRIGEITRAMKDFSHPGNDARAAMDPRRIIENSAIVCRNEWKYVADLKMEFDPELTTLLCLPGELSQVLVILIVNAAQAIIESKGASPDPLGKITIRTKRVDEWAEISVEDDGAGIAPENLSRIFEPFFTTKEVGMGTGQGLAIAHSVIVGKHGGSISVASTVGQGTTFTLRLQIDEPDTADEMNVAHSSHLTTG